MLKTRLPFGHSPKSHLDKKFGNVLARLWQEVWTRENQVLSYLSQIGQEAGNLFLVFPRAFCQQSRQKSHIR